MHDNLAPRQSALRTALAGLIGNVLEWFDFAVYGFFASDIGAQFFPQSSETSQLLKSYGVYALGFAARPIGSIVLGMVGDRIGRRALLTLSIALMGCATLGIGLLPPYAQIGVAAPILLVLLRMVQGFSLGGEFTGSMVYTTELASPAMRGLISSSTAAGTTLGFILGTASASLIKHVLDPAQASAWGWRLPFIASVGFVAAGWLLRRGIQETEHGMQAATVRAPIVASLIADWLPIVRTFGIVAMTNAAYYLTFVFAVEQRKSLPGAADTDFFLVNVVTLFVVLFAKPFGGWLSDRVGRRRLMISLTLVTVSVSYSALSMMFYGTANEFMLGQILLAVPLGMALGLQGAMVVEIFPLRTRVTSMSVAYSITLALAGGTAPLLATWLIAMFGLDTAFLVMVGYVAVYGLIGIALMWRMTETNTRSLGE